MGHAARGERSLGFHRQRGSDREVSSSHPRCPFRWVKLSDIPVHGDALGGKADGDCRLLFENIDGFGVKVQCTNKSNKNLKYYNSLLHRLDVDFLGGAEARCQWDMLPHTHSLPKLLDLREGSRSCYGHNEHEKFSVKQQGGTFLASSPHMGDMVMEMGKDETGLGRWCWMKVAGRFATTRIVVAYQPCSTRKEAPNATMAQHRRYWRSHGDRQCPRRLFRYQLTALLASWRHNGDKIILMLDSNENMQSGPLSKILRGSELEMQDVVQSRTSFPGPPTFIRGTRQIDAIWATPDLSISRACFLPFNFGLGDHRGILLDVSQSSLLGTPLHTIPRISGRRLQCNKTESQRKYVNAMQLYCHHHRLQSKIYHLLRSPGSGQSFHNKLNAIDKVLGEGMRHAEKKCRHIYAGEVPFSPEVAHAGLLIKLWGLVIRYRKGRNINS